MIYSTFHRGGGGTLPLVATPLSLGGGAHERHDQRGDARHHRPGVSGGYHYRLCRRKGPQQRRWFRNAVAAYRGRADADSVGCKPSRGMVGRRGDAQTYSVRDAQSQPRHLQGHWLACRSKLGRRVERSIFQQHVSVVILDRFNVFSRRKRCPQQHAAVAGCMPLEARSLSYTRKGAAV